MFLLLFIIIYVLIFAEYHFALGRGDIWRFSALVLYPSDKRRAADAGRTASNNWGINSFGLSCKELSHHQPISISHFEAAFFKANSALF